MKLEERQIEIIDDKVAQILRKKLPQERLKMVWDAWNFFCQALKSFLSSSHPEWTKEQIQKEILRRLYSETK